MSNTNEMTKPRAGFTLIELMITVGIVGILASVAMPTFSRYKENVRDAEASIMLASMAQGAKAYFIEERQYGREVSTAELVGACTTEGGSAPDLGGGEPGWVGIGEKVHIDFSRYPSTFGELGVSGAGDYYHAFVIISAGGNCWATGGLPDGSTPYIFLGLRPIDFANLRVGVVAMTRDGDDLVRTPGMQWWEVAYADLGSVISAYNPLH